MTHKCSIFYSTLLLIISLYNVNYGKLVITEVLRNPVGSEIENPGGKSHEYVEIFNLGTDTVFIRDLFMSDGKSVDSLEAVTFLLPFHQNCITNRSYLLPRECAVIIDRDYQSVKPSDAHFFPEKTVLLTTDHSSLVGGLTGSKGVFIYKGRRDSISTIESSFTDSNSILSLGKDTYITLSHSEGDGISLHRRDILFDSLMIRPGEKSPGTPHRKKLPYLLEYRIVDHGSYIYLNARFTAIHNTMGSVSWTVRSTDKNSVLGKGALLSNYDVQNFSVTIPKSPIQYQLGITINGQDNVVDINISQIWAPPRVVKVNEIFPRSTQAIPEWIEFVNISPMIINLHGWTVGTSLENLCTISEDVSLGGGEYVVFTSDKDKFLQVYPTVSLVYELTSWKTLNNYDDTILIYNSHGDEEERVFYDYKCFRSWHNESIGRVNFDYTGRECFHWYLSKAPSPGTENFDKKFHTAVKPTVFVEPVLFTPNNDGINDKIFIQCQSPGMYTQKIEIINFQGKYVRTIENPSREGIYWDGNDDYGKAVYAGPFFIVAYFTQGKSTTMIRKKAVLWR